MMLNSSHRRVLSSLAILSALASTYLAVADDGTSSSNPSGVGASKAFNPDISVNFLGYFRKSNLNTGDLIGRTSDVHNGFTFQEAEMQFFADVDPYFRANALFSLGPSSEVSAAQPTQSSVSNGVQTLTTQSGFALDPEEVYLETISLPMVTFKAGKFKASLGKHNTLHTHAFPFIDAPLINQDLLGGEGLNETGLSAAVLAPTDWFLEVTGQILNNSNNVLYDSPNSGDISGVVQIKNLFDLSDDWTLEFSLYGTQGKNQNSSTASVGGSDLIFKWRPSVGGKYQALIFASEYLYGYSPVTGFNVGPSDAKTNGDRLAGIASWLQYQFAQRWWIQGRYEYEGITRSGTLPVRNKESALIGFYPSEFSGFRVQYDNLSAENQATEHAVTLQWNITIGAHPAHSY